MAAKYPSVPEPVTDLLALRNSVVALKEITEMLTLQRGSPLNAAVTWQDLVNLDLIPLTKVPIKLANR